MNFPQPLFRIIFLLFDGEIYCVLFNMFFKNPDKKVFSKIMIIVGNALCDQPS